MCCQSPPSTRAEKISKPMGSPKRKADRITFLSELPKVPMRMIRKALLQSPCILLMISRFPHNRSHGIRQPAIRRSQAGSSLIEVMIACGVMMVGLLALTSTSVVVHSLDQTDDARKLAGDALRSMVDRVHAMANRSLDDPISWSNGVTTALNAGGSPGDEFDVTGLNPWANAASVGTIEVVIDETLSDADLGLTLGLPRDLTGDGVMDETDATLNAGLLPVVVRVRWEVANAQQELTQAFFIVGM